MTVVSSQVNGDGGPHNRTLDATKVTPAGATSLVSRFADCDAPWPPDVVSALAVTAGGAVTVGVIVEFATCPTESLTWYLMAVAVP